jgi:hypothetical protein
VRLVEAAAKDEPMATVGDAMLHHRQSSPIKKPWPFGSLALTEALPILWAQRLVCDVGYVTEQVSRWSLHTDDFDGGNR